MRDEIDVCFSAIPALSRLVPYVFGLLASPLIRLQTRLFRGARTMQENETVVATESDARIALSFQLRHTPARQPTHPRKLMHHSVLKLTAS